MDVVTKKAKLTENEKTIATAFKIVDEAFTEISMISADMRRLSERLDVTKQRVWDAKKILGMATIGNDTKAPEPL